MKVDVEGHEPAVMRGATGLIATQKPVMLIEIERRHNATAFEEVEDFLKDFGYTSWRLRDGRLVPVTTEEIDGLQVLPLSADGHYVNNFIFIPPERHELWEKLRG
jgi:hypothetical protein